MNHKIIYQLQEFGLTPKKMVSRLFAQKVTPILANSLPKSGTNLLSRTLSFIPAAYRLPIRTLSVPRYTEDRACRIIEKLDSNQVALAHLKYGPRVVDAVKRSGARHVLMFRDLRDVLVSAAHYIGSMDKAHVGYHVMRDLSIDERIGYMLGEETQKGNTDNFRARETSSGLSFPDEVRSFLMWLDRSDVLMVKYENLIGPDGGGSRELQLGELKKIGGFIGWTPRQADLDAVASRIYYRKAKTFRSGGQGGWKDAFTEKNKSLFKDLLGDDLVRLGYERDLNW